MQKFKAILNKIMETACSLIFALMIIVGTYQIVTRYVFSRPSTISEELLTYSFTWLAMLAAAYVFGKRDHMRMSFVADKVSPKGQIMLSIFAEIATIVFTALVLLYGGVAITQLTMSQITASLGIPMGYVYIIIPICGIITIIYDIINISELLSKLKGV